MGSSGQCGWLASAGKTLLKMQKISLKVLLRFLGQYSHWNLVRRSDCYHLYFVTKESSSCISTFPTSRCKQREQRGRRKATKLNRDARETVPYVRKQKKEDSKEGKRKDVFVFSPIFQNAEQAVHVGLDNAIDDKSTRRSSVSSYIWDDFLPAYKKESDLDDDEEDKSSFTSIETITDFDSRESTPCQSEHSNDYKKTIKENKI